MANIDLNLEIAAALKAVAASSPPNWVRALATYRSRWYDAIGAKVMAKDEDGPTVVCWCGHAYVRRCGESSKYGPAIWFSRGAGKDESGDSRYLRLITFRPDAIPHAAKLPSYVKKALNESSGQL